MASGRAERKSVTLFWRLENMVNWEDAFHSYAITSPCFSIPFLDTRRRFMLQFYPKFEEGENDNLDIWTSTARSQELSCRRDIAMPDCPTYDKVFVAEKNLFLPRGTLSVRCQIWKSDSNFPSDKIYSGRSLLVGDSKCVNYAFKLSSKTKLNKKKYFHVPCRFNSGHKEFALLLSLIGDTLEDSELEIRLENVLPVVQVEMLKLKVSILNAERKEVKSMESKREFRLSEAREKWTLPRFVTRKELLEANSPFMCGEILNLSFRFTILCKAIVNFLDRTYIGTTEVEHDGSNGVSTPAETSVQAMNKLLATQDKAKHGSDSLESFSDQINTIFTEKKFTDFTLCCEGATYAVHKSVLNSGSGFFREMFSKETTGTDSMDIVDIDKQTLGRMLIFLYTGSIVPNLQCEDIVELYRAAKIYLVPSLKHECGVVINSCFTADKVIEDLILADKDSNEELRSAIYSFVVSRFDEIMLSDEWEMFVDIQPSLAAKSIHQLHMERIKDSRI